MPSASVTDPMSSSASRPFKTAAEARAAAGFVSGAGGGAPRDPGLVAALRALCRSKGLGHDVAESAGLWRALAMMQPRVRRRPRIQVARGLGHRPSRTGRLRSIREAMLGTSRATQAGKGAFVRS